MKYDKKFVKSDGRRLLKGGPRDQQLRAKTTADSSVVNSLMEQISELKLELANIKSGAGDSTPAPSKYFTAEQVDEEIRKAVSQAMAEATISLKKNGPDPNVDSLIKKYKEQIVSLQKSNDDFTIMHHAIIGENKDLKEKIVKLESENSETSELKSKIAVLEQSLAGKDEVIETLKSRPAIINSEVMMPEDPDRPQMEQVFVDPLEEGAGTGLKSNIKNRELTRDVDDGEVDDKVNKLKDLLGSKLPKRI